MRDLSFRGWARARGKCKDKEEDKGKGKGMGEGEGEGQSQSNEEDKADKIEGNAWKMRGVWVLDDTMARARVKGMTMSALNLWLQFLPVVLQDANLVLVVLLASTVVAQNSVLLHYCC